MKFKYVGPADAVDLVGVGTVAHDEAIEVSDSDIAKGLRDQQDWQAVSTPKRSTVDADTTTTEGA